MSKHTVEFFWDVASPYTYLASTRIEQVARVCDAHVVWRPFLLGGVFRESGNRPPVEVPLKGAYMLDDLQTWASYYKIPFQFPPCFPVNSLSSMRAAVAADRLGKGKEFAAAIMHLYWVEGKDPSMAENIDEAAGSVGLDGERIRTMTQDPGIKEALKENSQEAVRRGAFGAPAMFVGAKMFWGNDRLILLEAYLKGDLPRKEK